jgi:hypothetical protein
MNNIMPYKKSNTILINCEQERGESPRPHKRQKSYPSLDTLSALLSLSKPTAAKERPLRQPNELPFVLLDANAGCFNSIPNRVVLEEEDEGYSCEAKEFSTAYSQPVFYRSFTNHVVCQSSSWSPPPLVTSEDADTTSTRKRKMKTQRLPTILPAGRPLPASPILRYALAPGVMLQK